MADSRTVLLVEDDENWQDTLGRLLKGVALEVVGMSEYSGALARILRAEAGLADELHLCVSDLRLPSATNEENFDALGLLADCRLKGIPTVVVSGFLNRRLTETLHDEYGVICSFDKYPFDPDQFMMVVKSALSVRREFSRPRRTDQVATQSRAGKEEPGPDHESADALRQFEFRTRLQAILNSVIEHYQRAHSMINARQLERRTARGRSDPQDELIWRQQLMALDAHFHSLVSRLENVRALTELDELHSDVIRECIGWGAD